jgi:hypothetical protein
LYAAIKWAVAAVQPVVILIDPALDKNADISESAASLPTELPIEQAHHYPESLRDGLAILDQMAAVGTKVGHSAGSPVAVTV